MSAVPLTPVAEERVPNVMHALGVLREYLEHPADADERRLVVNAVRKLVEKKAPPVVTEEQLRGFEIFWTHYPKRKGMRAGKPQARLKWAKFSYEDKKLAYKAMLNYADYCSRTEQYACDACRFLNNDYWRDFLEQADPIAPERPSWVPAHAVPDGQGGWMV